MPGTKRHGGEIGALKECLRPKGPVNIPCQPEEVVQMLIKGWASVKACFTETKTGWLNCPPPELATCKSRQLLYGQALL